MNMPLENTLSFPHGLLGLEDYNEFNLFHPESDKPTVFEMQAKNDDDFALSVVSPEALNLELNITLTDEEQALLELTDAEDAVIAVIIYKPIKGDQEQPMKALVKTPLIINAKTKLAMQKALGESDSVS